MDFDKSSIERLKRTLYSRNENIVPQEKRTPVQPASDLSVPTDFGEAPNFNLSLEDRPQNNSFFNKFLLGAGAFFLIALGVAGFVFFGGWNTISSNNVDIQVTAPSFVSSGDELPISLSVINSNPTSLEGVTLYIDYPEGVTAFDAPDKELSHDRIDLGNIAKGKSKDYTARTVVVGAKDIVKTFALRLEYKVTGSNAIFSKEKTFDVTIGSSPLILDVTLPSEVNSGEPMTISVMVTSNSIAVMKNTMIKVEYPFGFTYKTASAKPAKGNSLWNVGDLKSGDKKNVTIMGVLVGQDLEDRSFRVTAGTQSADTTKDFSTELASFLGTVGIRKSFFNLSVNSSETNTVSAGQSAPVYIKWENTLPDKIINAQVEARISGSAFDRANVSTNNGGFYRSGDNTVFWDKNTTSNLVEIAPGENGQVSFSVGALSTNQLMTNPHIDVHVVVTGERSGADTGTVSSSADVTIKLPSVLSLGSKSYRAVGPFSNNGPIPPKADAESTYTVTWTLTNTVNNLKDAVVTTTLPVGVEWKSQTSPNSERVSFDPATRVVSWNVGNVSAGIGFTNSAREVSFQVGLTPNVNQIGTVPNLTSGVNAFATDTYAGTSIQVGAEALSTRYSDVSFRLGQETVVK